VTATRDVFAAALDAIRRFAREQWPILVVSAVFLAALGLVIADRWRRGALVVGIAVGVAAALRLVLTDETAGLLAVRSKSFDVGALAAVAAVMVYLALTIDPLGTG
jgi:predicted neutral ceramidase superfamily lipid hydrolase